VLKKIFLFKREKTAGGMRCFITHHLLLSNMIRMGKSRSLTWAGHVTCMEKIRSSYRVLV
jgi:hypothetical protein